MMKMCALRWSGLFFGGFDLLDCLHQSPGPRSRPLLLRVRVVLRRSGVITASVRLNSSGTTLVTRWVGTPHWTCR